MGGKLAGLATSRRLASAAVVILLGVGAILTGCEYTYDDRVRADESPAATVAGNVVLPPDPSLEQTVTGQALDEWAKTALPESQGRSFYSSSGYLSAGESKTEQTVQLPGGTYAVTLACRGTRRVSFSVRMGETDLVDLTLGCTNARVSVVQLDADAILNITVGTRSEANFAYRVSRL